MLEKAREMVNEVVVDLEDVVVPERKAAGNRGAVALNGEMLDEALRLVAVRALARAGR